MAAGELGVKGRRKEQELEGESETTVKRRKLEEEVDVLVESRIIYSPCVQGTNRGGILERNSAGASETSVVIVRRRDSPVEEQCQNQDVECDGLFDRSSSSVSCCSSNNNTSHEKPKRKIEFVDFQENNGGEFDQMETSWIYDNFKKRRDPEQEESVGMENQEVESRRRLKMKLKNSKSSETVKEAELEGFFQAAEKDLRNKMLECSRKYNFDFEKDEPLGGRYEWVKLNP